MREIIFCHGFAFNPLFWQNLLPYFGKEKISCIDLGYFNEIKNIQTTKALPLIGIGHSLGLIKLLNLGMKFDCLIGMNSFVNFLGNNEMLRKKRNIELRAMRRAFTGNISNAMSRFYNSCDVRSFFQLVADKSINVEMLLADLDLLESSFVIPNNIPTLIIAASNDQIVPPEIMYDNFNYHSNVKMEIVQDGGHGLGFNNETTMYKKIMNFINAHVFD